MMDISLAGLLGAIAGTLIAAALYHLSIGPLNQRMRERAQQQTAEQRDSMEFRLSLMRRVVLTTDLILFAGLGYWLGQQIAG